MRAKRRSRIHHRRSTPSHFGVEGKVKVKDRRLDPAIRMFFSLVLLASGALILGLAQESDAVVRRFLGPAIQSPSALPGAEQGQAVLLRGRIEPQTSDLEWGFAVFDREHLTPGILWNRYGARPTSTWLRQRGHHPPFTLVTSEGRISIVNGGYAIERPRSRQQITPERYAGFKPEDEVLVAGAIDKGGVIADRVFGGTPDEFRKTLLMRQRVLIPAGRVLGCLLVVPGLVLVAPWVRSRIRGDALGGHS